MNQIRTYSELIQFPTFVERFRYLSLQGVVAERTFGSSRYLNQDFYRSKEWKQIRDGVILRDNCCDLAVDGYAIYGKVIIHHLNPITVNDIVKQTEFLINPEYLICVTHQTHNAIHYGDENLLLTPPIERTRNDTCPWKR